MVGESELSHQYPGEADLVTRAGQQGAHFRSVAENVALGPTPQAIEQEWMHSAPHRANILDPQMNAIGIGIVKKGGSYYAVEDFADSVAQLGPRADREEGRNAFSSSREFSPRDRYRMRARHARWSMGRRAGQRRSS